MNKKKALGITLAALIVLVLLYLLLPRSFAQIVKESADVDLEDVTVIQVLTLDSHQLDYVLEKDDPQFQALLDLLNSRRYCPTLGSPPSRDVLLGDTVLLSLGYDVSMDFCGDPDIGLTSPKHTRYIHTSDSLAFQQALLDFLLDAAPEKG